MKKGFTLLELMIAVTIFAGLIIMSIGAIASTSTYSKVNEDKKESTKITQYTRDQIMKDINSINTSLPTKSSIPVPGYSPTTYPYNTYIYNKTPVEPFISPSQDLEVNALTLVIPTLASDGTSDKTNITVYMLSNIPPSEGYGGYSKKLLFKTYENCTVVVNNDMYSTKYVDCGEFAPLPSGMDPTGAFDPTTFSDFFNGKYVLDLQSSQSPWGKNTLLGTITFNFYYKPNNDEYLNHFCSADDFYGPSIPPSGSKEGCHKFELTMNTKTW